MTDASPIRLLNQSSERFAAAVLAEHGWKSEPLDLVSGWSNQVWLAPEHVVRISSGRFQDAFAHECRIISSLPSRVPHAPIRFYGRVGNREWIIQDRMTGEPLRDVWTRLNESQRRAAAEQLGIALVHLHSIPMSAEMRNPWLEQALSERGKVANAYHAPPESHNKLINAVSGVPGVDRWFLEEVRTFIAERLDAFEGDSRVLVHGDLHFNNLLYYGGQLVAILDFEGARPATPDQELDTLLRQVREPNLLSPPHMQNMLAPGDLNSFADALNGAYPDLFEHPRLTERLQVYDALWHLVQLLHFPPGGGHPDPYGHLKALVNESTWADKPYFNSSS